MADRRPALAWLANAAGDATGYVIHAEPGAAHALRDRIDAELGWTVVVPSMGERVLLPVIPRQ